MAQERFEDRIADRGGGQLFFCAVEKLLIGMLLMYAQNIDLIAVTQDVTVLPRNICCSLKDRPRANWGPVRPKGRSTVSSANS